MKTDLSQFTKQSGKRLHEVGLKERTVSQPKVGQADSNDLLKLFN